MFASAVGHTRKGVFAKRDRLDRSEAAWPFGAQGDPSHMPSLPHARAGRRAITAAAVLTLAALAACDRPAQTGGGALPDLLGQLERGDARICGDDGMLDMARVALVGDEGLAPSGLNAVSGADLRAWENGLNYVWANPALQGHDRDLTQVRCAADLTVRDASGNVSTRVFYAIRPNADRSNVIVEIAARDDIRASLGQLATQHFGASNPTVETAQTEAAALPPPRPLPPRVRPAPAAPPVARPEEPAPEKPKPTRRSGLITAPTWERSPPVEYPERAMSRGIESGLVVLRCRPNASGALSNCMIVSESPAGAGFGQAALAGARRARLSPDTVNDIDEDASVQFTVRFSTQ